MLKSIRKILYLLCIFLFVGFVSIYFYVLRDLPDYQIINTQELPASTIVYSINQDVVAHFAHEKRTFVTFDKIPKVVVDAFISAEDKNFFHHNGIDLYSIVRAFFHNLYHIKDSSKRVVGGSTITQQLVKCYLLSPEKSIKRKIKEAILAYRVDQALPKERILELYLNKIFLGNNAHGIAAAAHQYFNKQLSDLNVAEAALLASLPKAPTSLNPYVYYEKAKLRRDWVMSRMLDNGYISEKDYMKYSVAPITLHRHNLRAPSYYASVVKDKLTDLYTEDTIYLNGLRVHTFLDNKVQKIAENVFSEHLNRYDSNRSKNNIVARISLKNQNWKESFEEISKNTTKGIGTMFAVVIDKEERGIKLFLDNGKNGYISNSNTSSFEKGVVLEVFNIESDIYKIVERNKVNGSMIVLQAYTGNVLAMIGGRGGDYFNRAIQAKRQPGSAFKTFIYLSAIENGLAFDTKVVDEPIVVDQGQYLEPWVPKNYEGNFLGEITLEEAFVKSRNIPTVLILMSVGLNKVKNTIEKFGLYSRNQMNKFNYSLALGAYEITLLDMTNAYNVIASNGYITKPRFISKIYDKDGNVLYNDLTPYCNTLTSERGVNEEGMGSIRLCRKRIIKQEDVNKIKYLLNKVTTHGTARKVSYSGLKNVGGKTGTTNNSYDAWFIGIVGDITVGIHVGYDSPRNLGEKASGANVALPIFIDFVHALIREKKITPNVNRSSAVNIVESNFDVER